jgi:hypothetical protein
MLEVLPLLSFLGAESELRRGTMKDQVNVIVFSYNISTLHSCLPEIP